MQDFYYKAVDYILSAFQFLSKYKHYILLGKYI